MKTSAKTVLKSRVSDGHYLAGTSRGWVATLEVTFPRVILAERATHRVLSCGTEFVEIAPTSGEWMSKNSASSRAIPVAAMIEAVRTEPYVPSRAGMAFARGMGGVEMEEKEYEREVAKWLSARSFCADVAESMAAGGCSKQVVNRLLEPWLWVPQLLTGSGEGWSNFLALRLDAGADPAIQELARVCYSQLSDSTPWQQLRVDEWHVPYVGVVEWDGGGEVPIDLKTSAARCAWLSYSNHLKEAGVEAVLRTWDRLVTSAPVHASPCEHQLTCPGDPGYVSVGNIRSWLQLRGLLPGESVGSYPGIGPKW